LKKVSRQSPTLNAPSSLVDPLFFLNFFGKLKKQSPCLPSQEDPSDSQPNDILGYVPAASVIENSSSRFEPVKEIDSPSRGLPLR
jgi:uncharacterized Zn-finger protein